MCRWGCLWSYTVFQCSRVSRERGKFSRIYIYILKKKGIFPPQQQKKAPNQSVMHTSSRGHLCSCTPAALLHSLGVTASCAAVARRLSWGHTCCRGGKKPGRFILHLAHYVWPNVFICAGVFNVSGCTIKAGVSLLQKSQEKKQLQVWLVNSLQWQPSLLFLRQEEQRESEISLESEKI